MKNTKSIRCASCRFIRADRMASDRDWTAIMCGNPASVYHKALLNVSIDGDKQSRITWTGCEKGEERKVAP